MTVIAAGTTTPIVPAQPHVPDAPAAAPPAAPATRAVATATSTTPTDQVRSAPSLLGLFDHVGDAISDSFTQVFGSFFQPGGPSRPSTWSLTPPPPVAPPAPPVVAPERPPFEPKGFLYNDRFFKKYHAAGGIDVKDMDAVEDRIIRATFAYILKEEPDVDDLGVIEVQVRKVDPVKDRDLLRVNPRALYIVDLIGVQGDGTERVIPSVMNSDGAVFVDPRIRNG